MSLFKYAAQKAKELFPTIKCLYFSISENVNIVSIFSLSSWLFFEYIFSAFLNIFLLLTHFGSSVKISNFILNFNKVEESLVSESSKLVKVITVQNSINPINLSVDGRVKSKNRINLYSEVSGILNFNENTFVEGNSLKKNEIIFSVNSDEFHSSVKQARSELQNLIASVLPDIKIDFNDNFKNWESYFKNFNVNKSVSELPESNSEKEKYYIVGRGIQSAYYKVRSLEERLNKYFMYAPFNGSLIDVKINEGTMVNPGMLLGSFISDDNFELTVNIPSKYVSDILINEEIKINLNGNDYRGFIKRINKNIDRISQTVGVHIEFKNNRLKDGMYVKTKIPLRINKEGFSISRSNLINDSFVYVAESNNTVGIRNVEIIYYDEDSVIVSGLENNTSLISSYIPGIYKGMKIKISN